MNILKHTLLAASLLFVGVLAAQHNHELFVTGQLYIEDSSEVTVVGDVEIDTGTIHNAGKITVAGHWKRATNGKYRRKFENKTGKVVFKNGGTDNAGEDQYIEGGMTGDNAFGRLVVQKNGALERLYIKGGDVEVAKKLKFVKGRVRSGDVIDLGDSWLAQLLSGILNGYVLPYQHEFFVSNDNAGSLNNASNGTLDNYVEGNLRRSVKGSNTYYFPVGDSVNVAPVSIQTVNSPETTILINYIDAQASQQANATSSSNGNGNGNGNGAKTAMPGVGDAPLSSGRTVRSKDEVIDADVQHGGWGILSDLKSGQLEYTLIVHDNGTVARPPADMWILASGEDVVREADGKELAIASMDRFGHFDLVGLTADNVAAQDFMLQELTVQQFDEAHLALQWSAEAVAFDRHIDVQESFDGITFETLPELSQQAQFSGLRHFSAFVDVAELSAPRYYRLMFTDAFGNYTYSEVVRFAPVAATTDEVADTPATTAPLAMNAYPVPAQRGMTITIQTPAALGKAATLTLTDGTGRIASQQSLRDSAGNSRVELGTDRLVPGLYFATITDGDATYQTKLTIVR